MRWQTSGSFSCLVAVPMNLPLLLLLLPTTAAADRAETIARPRIPGGRKSADMSWCGEVGWVRNDIRCLFSSPVWYIKNRLWKIRWIDGSDRLVWRRRRRRRTTFHSFPSNLNKDPKDPFKFTRQKIKLINDVIPHHFVRASLCHSPKSPPGLRFLPSFHPSFYVPSPFPDRDE